VLEVARSRLLLAATAAFYVAVAALIMTQWDMQYGAPVWAATAAFVGWVYTYHARLNPEAACGSMPSRIIAGSDGTWRLDDRQGFVRSALITPWVCRVVISRVDGGRDCIWLARDALGEFGHWHLRRRLVQITG
jgi:integral membrane sensor domain MASE1